MKKIYINENQISKELLLPKFIFDAVMRHETSLGDNPAFPGEDDYPFDYMILKERLKDLHMQMQDIGLTLEDTDELVSTLASMVNKCRRMEEPIKDSLEKLCENAINRLFAIPEGLVNIKCKLVDKVKYDISLSVTPESSVNKKFRFKDIKDFDQSKAAITKRRLIDSLIMGASEYYTAMKSLYMEELNRLNPELLELYDRIMILNSYINFITEEEMTDERPKQGSYVEVYVGGNGKKSTIHAQGLIFPLLLHDTIKGFFELFSCHGLPSDRDKREYIIKKADFLLAEPWDMRFGVKLWTSIFDRIEFADNTNIIPYIFMELVKLPVEEFNGVMKELFMGTEAGDAIMQGLISKSMYNDGYQKFKNRINARNLDRSVIADSYFTAAELDGFNLDGEESEDVIEEHQDGFVEYYGIFLDDSSKEKLRSLAPQNAYKIYCDHMTLAHSSKFTDDVVETCRALLGKQFTLTATTIGISDDAVAVGIETDCFSVNEHKHITVCTLTPNSKPVQSNYIEKWYRLKEPIILNGTVMGFTSNGLVT